jgi:hypothetical protein
MSLRAILVWSLAYGVLWNALGWAGNNILLEADWDAVGAQLTPDFAPPYSGVARELATLVPDFLYGFMFVWIFSRLRVANVRSAVALVLVLSLGVVITYLAMVTSGFLPWEIAAKTTALAVAIFILTAPIIAIARSKRGAQDR